MVLLKHPITKALQNHVLVLYIRKVIKQLMMRYKMAKAILAGRFGTYLHR